MQDIRNFFGNAAGNQLFLNQRCSDVDIRVEWDGGQWQYPGHKLILSAMSKVFQTMFKTDMKENDNGVIVIKDNSPLTVRQFLKYLYTGVLEFNGWQEAVELMKTAHKYSVGPLVTMCENYLITVITFSNACDLYEIAQTYSLGTLSKDACNFIMDAAFIVTATEGFTNLLPVSLDFFLSSSRLNMENECCVLATLKEWALVECCRRCIPLTRDNILKVMEPFMKNLNWDFIPEDLRTFVYDNLVERYSGQAAVRRKPFHVSSSLQYHINVLKFVVELGAFNENRDVYSGGMSCLKFGVDNHAYVAGFRMVGLFRASLGSLVGPSSLTLGRDDDRCFTQFNLQSLPWNRGSKVGDYVWREMTAYFPYPIRISPFNTYAINLKCPKRTDTLATKWPLTRQENMSIITDLGPINFQTYSVCYGITQLFLLPAPPIRNVCNYSDL